MSEDNIDYRSHKSFNAIGQISCGRVGLGLTITETEFRNLTLIYFFYHYPMNHDIQ